MTFFSTTSDVGETPLAVTVAGGGVDVHVVDPDLRRACEPVLAPIARLDGVAGVMVSVRGTGPWRVSSPKHTATADRLDQAVSEVMAAVNLSGIAASPLLAAHCAVLGRAGRTLVVPAASGGGKTTLTAALLLEGWSYVSDEALCVTWEDGRLLPYPRALALSPWSERVLGLAGGIPADGEHLYPPAALGAIVDEAPGPVTDVLLLRRRDGDPALSGGQRQESLAALLRRGFTVHHDPARALVLLTDLVAGASTWTLDLGDPRSAARLVTESIGSSP